MPRWSRPMTPTQAAASTEPVPPGFRVRLPERMNESRTAVGDPHSNCRKPQAADEQDGQAKVLPRCVTCSGAASKIEWTSRQEGCRPRWPRLQRNATPDICSRERSSSDSRLLDQPAHLICSRSRLRTPASSHVSPAPAFWRPTQRFHLDNPSVPTMAATSL